MTGTDFKVGCELDTWTCPERIKVREEEIANLNIKGDAFHPDPRGWHSTDCRRRPPALCLESKAK
jgi:hypothetical protein